MAGDAHVDKSCCNRLEGRRPQRQVNLWHLIWARSHAERPFVMPGACRTKSQWRVSLPCSRRAGLADELTSLFEASLAVPVPKESVRADANKPPRRNVHQKASLKLLRFERTQPLLIPVPVVTPPERDLTILVRLDPVIGDRNAIDVPRQILE